MNGHSRTSANSPARRLTALGLALVLCACATSPHGRTQFTSPAPISDVYSDAEMQLDLAILPSIQTPCTEEECELNRAFDAQVQQLGARIAAAAYDAHPDLIERISHFEFEVVEKGEPGITSNASGKIVILRGTQQIGLDEGALTFVIAREMGHVISQHHNENTTTRIILSIAAGLLFPALNLFGNSAAIAQATSASTATSVMMATTAASSATSYLGAKLLIHGLRPEQLSEADQVALNLLERMGWSHHDLAQALENSAEFEPSNEWSEELRFSVAQFRSLVNASAAIEALPENPILESNLAPAESEELEPLQAASLDVASDAGPDAEASPASVADTPSPALSSAAVPIQAIPPAVAATLMKQSSQASPARREKFMTRPAQSLKKPGRDSVRQKTKAATSRLKKAQDVQKSRAGKGAKSKPAKVSERSKKPATAKDRAPQKSKKPSTNPAV